MKRTAAVKRKSIVGIKVVSQAETCVWSSVRQGWQLPGHGENAEQLVDSARRAKPGEEVVLSQAWKGHYPTLQLKPGKLVKRVGQFWAVAFEGQPVPLLMNTNLGMQQLAYATPAEEPAPQGAFEAPQ